MATDYQGNTRKEREKSENKERPEKRVEKVIVGEVIQKPKGTWYKFRNVFLGGDAKQAARYVTTNVFFPAVRNIIYDVVKGYAERVIFPDSEYRRRSPSVNYNQVQYQNRQPIIQNPFNYRERRELTQTPIVRQNRYEMNDIILGTQEEADLVIERLNDVIDQYQVVSLGDLYDLLGLQTSHIDNKWGWTRLHNVQVRQIKEGYLLELPLLEEI